MARRPPSRSGSARRPAAATSSPHRCRACGRRRGAPGDRSGRGQRPALARSTRSASTSRPRASWSTIWPRRTRRWAACRRRTRSCSSASSTTAGGMQLVIHSPYGSRINRAWGLALRKRFCRKFNFELQAAATEDNIVLSLTTAHSFELGEVARYLHSASVRPVLIQAMLDAPMFVTRWRWVAGVALALPRFRGGKKVPPQLARMDAEDLIAAVFPDQLACAENLVGEREVPDHPLVEPDHRRLPDRGHGHRWPGAAARAARDRRHRRRRARSDRAVAAGARSAVGATLCLSRRRAARGAPHPSGDEPALAGAGGGGRPRPARYRGDRAGARRSLARSGERR